MEHNYQSSVSDDYSFSGGGASGYTGTPSFSRRGRGSHQGRARGRYYSNSYSRYPQEGSRHGSIDSRKGDTATARGFSDHLDSTYNSEPGPLDPAMEDLYDDRPLDEAPPSGDQKQLEDRSRGVSSSLAEFAINKTSLLIISQGPVR